MTDYFDDDESMLFSSTDAETGGDENEISKEVTESETVGKSKPGALENNKTSLHKLGDVVRDSCSF